MNLSDLIQVVPVVLVEKKKKSAIKRSHSLSSASSLIKKQKKTKRKIKTKAIKTQIVSHTSDSQSDEMKICVYSINEFQQRAMRRLSMKKRKSLEMKRSESTHSKNKLMEDQKSVKVAMENAKKRITERQIKLDEEKDRISDLIKKDKENYAKRKKDRNRAKIEEQQKRARIYLLNYLYKTKYDLMSGAKT